MAGFDLYYGAADDDVSKIAYLMQLFNQVRLRRVNFEVQWEEAAAIYLPEYRNSWSVGHNRPPGVKYTQYQVDSSAGIAAHRFMAIGNALVTPHTMLWSAYRPVKNGQVNLDLWKERQVQLYYSQLTQLIWGQRYRPEANFLAAQLQNWLVLGVFGNQAMFVDKLETSPGEFSPGIRYIPQSPGEIYLLTNYQGRVDGCVRHFRWTARQAYGRWKDKIPPMLKAAVEQNSTVMYDFLHFILPRTDYDPKLILMPQGKRYWSCYVSVTGFTVLEEGGYSVFPLAHGRYTQAPEEDNGRGPGQQVLAEAKTLNAEKADFLKQGHRAADPPLNMPEDGVVDYKNQPGAFNYGAISAQGQELVRPLLSGGQMQVSELMLQASQKIIDDAFLVSLFPLLFDQKGGQRSAREVMEIAQQQGIFLAPTLGRQFGEYLGVLTRREIDVLDSQGMMPEMPGILKEAHGEYQHGTVYLSPLARAMSKSQSVGYMRTVEFAREVVNITGDPEPLDNFDFDVAIPAMADDESVPPEWMAGPQKIAQRRQSRAKAQEADRQVKMMPGQAAIMKAKAISDKAQTGGNIGGTLSGQPQGAMPMMPGQQQPGGRAFGQPGQQPQQPGQPEPGQPQ